MRQSHEVMMVRIDSCLVICLHKCTASFGKRANTHTHMHSLPTILYPCSLHPCTPSRANPALSTHVPAQQTKGQLRLVHHRGTHILRTPHAPKPCPCLGCVRCQIERRLRGCSCCCYCCCCALRDNFFCGVLHGRVRGRHGSLCVLVNDKE